jgi:cytochrome c556
MKKKRTALLCSAALAGLLALACQSGAQVKQGKTRPLLTKQLMAGMVKPNCAGLGEALKGSGPADDKAWDAAATQAALLNESAHIMMADGRCPDAVWAGACKTLQDASQEALEKIKARDAAGAQGAFAAVTKSCGACHTAHKK